MTCSLRNITTLFTEPGKIWIIVQALAKHPVIPKEGLVLEVGCGRGRCKEFLGIDAFRIVQLDSSRQMLGIEERESCYLRVHADAASVPLFDEQFALVVGFLLIPSLD